MFSRIKASIGGFVVGAGVAACLFYSVTMPGGVVAHADNMDDLSRMSPFKPQSLWLMKQARAIIETYQIDAVSKDIPEDKMLYGAIRGMVAAWQDPYTRFVDPPQLKEEQIEMEGEYGGLGIYIGQRDGRTLVISPIEDTPADRAGLKPQDQIVKVGEEVILGWDSERVVRMLRGKAGTSVTIWVRREDVDKLLRFDIVREVIKLKSVRSEMLDRTTGYLRLSQFQQKSADDLRDAVLSLQKKGAKGMVFDLRNNGGGLLNGAVDISDMFLDSGLIVGMKGRVDRANDEIFATPGVLTAMPMVVLINEGSASASEIVAGALSDHGRALLVGKKSFGKGSVQTLFNMSDGSGIYVTIARYHTPSGLVIDHVGLTPTIQVDGELTKDHLKDKQLVRAREELKKLMRANLQVSSEGADSESE